MKIVMHCVYFPPEVGGLESHVYMLCRALVRAGHQVTVVTSRSLPDAVPHEVMEGVEVFRTWFPARNPVGWAAHAVASIRRTFDAARGADIVHAQAFASVLPCARVARRRGVPLVTTFHTSHFLMRADKPGWRGLLRRMVEVNDYALAASGEIADVAERLAPGYSVEALTNGVDTDDFQPVKPAFPPGERRQLVVPRRLFEKNGVEYFVRAMPLIREQLDVEALLIGDGPERERLESLASELGVAEYVRFLGRRAHSDMPPLLCSGSIAVFPSLMEATSVAALECMACGVPVAASNVGGLPEIVDDSVGALFEPANPEDLAKTVVSLMQREDLADVAQHARSRVVDHWSNARLAARHLEIYEELIENRQHSSPSAT